MAERVDFLQFLLIVLMGKRSTHSALMSLMSVRFGMERDLLTKRDIHCRSETLLLILPSILCDYCDGLITPEMVVPSTTRVHQEGACIMDKCGGDFSQLSRAQRILF